MREKKMVLQWRYPRLISLYERVHEIIVHGFGIADRVKWIHVLTFEIHLQI